MEYYNKFQNVIENTNYEITHSCCNGKGIDMYIIFKIIYLIFNIFLNFFYIYFF